MCTADYFSIYRQGEPMLVKKDKVATINYHLADDDGKTIDQSSDASFSYLHGANNILPGLEQALDGKKVGDAVAVTIEPGEAYGERQLENIQKVPRDMFPPDIDIEPGMQFKAQSGDGQPMTVQITAVEDDGIVVDGNHPLAGVRLHFDVEVMEVRDASGEELEHGHVHVEGEEAQ